MAFDPEASRRYMELVERGKHELLDRAIQVRQANENRLAGTFPDPGVVRIKRQVTKISEDRLARIECDECGRKILPVRAQGGYILPWHNRRSRYRAPEGYEPPTCPGSLTKFTWEATG